MATNLTGLRVFIASPQGLDAEREAFRREIVEVNEDEAHRRGIAFIPVEWSLTPGGLGRPQARINDELRRCDYLILVLHDRWGSPPFPESSTRFTSGTEEEFTVARECLASREWPMRDILVLFKGVRAAQLADPGPHLRSVLNFRAELDVQKELLYFTFDNAAEYRRLIRRHLVRWIRDFELSGIPRPRSRPSDETSRVVSDVRVAGTPESLLATGRTTAAEVAFAETMASEPSLEQCERYLDFLQRSGRFSLLKQTADEFLVKARASRDEYAVARVCTKLGQALRRQGHLETSENYLSEAVLRAESCRDEHPAAVTQALDQLGLTLRRLGRLSDAEVHFGRAMRSYQMRSDWAGLGQSLTNLALVHRDRENFDRALNILEKASRLLEQSMFPERLAIALSARGTVQADLGRLDEALMSFATAMEMNRVAEDEYGMAILLGQRAAAFIMLGEYEAAQRDAAQCLEINERYNSQEGMATALMLLGQIALAEGASDVASLYLLQSYQTFESVRHDFWAIVSGSDLAVAMLRDRKYLYAQEIVVSVQKRARESQVTLARTYFEKRYEELMNLSVEHEAGHATETELAGNG